MTPPHTRQKIPPLTALRSFEAAARKGSFREAAEELCVSHSAVSHQVKLLEKYLGVELFTRKSRAVELTKPGRLYYPVLRDAFDRIAQGTELILSPQSPGVLTVQVYSTFAIRWLIPRLHRFNTLHPDIQVRLSTSQDDVDFEHEDVDLCVMIGSRSAANLHYDYLFTPEMFPVGSPSLRSGDTPITSPNDLARHSILQVYPSNKDWYVWLESASVDSVDPRAGLQLDSYEIALTTATQGLGVALAMQPYISRDLESGQLVELFPGKRVEAPGHWYLVCRQERTKGRNIVAFREWMLAEISRDPELVDLRKELANQG